MKRRTVFLVVLVVLAAACGSATGPSGAALTIDQLKFKVIDAAGAPSFCDPDLYPIAREGGEQASAIAQYPQIRADAELYNAIAEHEHLPSGELDDAQKLTLYRAFKKVRALELAPSGEDYGFAYTAIGSTGFTAVRGTVRPDGVVTIASSAPGFRPNCPICLAASTLIATPAGSVVVTSVRPGMLVWTESGAGARIAMPVIEIGSTPVPRGHMMVHLRLADGRELWASPGHHTADGNPLGGLAVGEMLDGSRIVLWELVAYTGERTYDLLPAGSTGYYWADGILLASTLGA